ncbi:hypothetical protein ACNO5E_16355 [Vibrio parahaemolyticus]|uniref:hypothetical protein n=1 Tax=Vibrio parahaemolyticus TaxID=670 RepID=UPI0008135750|nr:hypothetical protein [Vibrio parahaemolyticus]OCP68391.1 hypothetical protein AKH08_16400 [Vibrio parahaemolyticus]
MQDNERIFVENKFLANAIERLLSEFIQDMPLPKVNRNQTDYSPLINAIRIRKVYLIKAANYLHETQSFGDYFNSRIEFENSVRKCTSGLENKKSLRPSEQLCVACWINVIIVLNSISEQYKDESIHSAKAKELSFMCAIAPVFAQFAKDL